MPEHPERVPDSGPRPNAAERPSHIRTCDERATEPAPPPHLVEEDGPPSTAPMGTASPRRPSLSLHVGEPSGEGPPSSRATLMPPASRTTPISSVPHPSPLDGMWFVSLRSLLRNMDPDHPAAACNPAAFAAQHATLRVIRVLVTSLQSFAAAITRGEPWTITARELHREGGKVTFEIAIEPAAADAGGEERA